MRQPIAVLVAGFVVSAVTAAEDDTKAELKRFEGSWEVVSIEASLMKTAPGKGAPQKAIIKDGKATFFAQGKELPTFKDLTLAIDPKKKPKVLDFIRGGNECLPCIYELTDQELKLAMPLVPKERKPGDRLPRPESFDTTGKPFLVLIMKRSKG
jgi:uncharacterized protein (TIGR03067 family)